MAAGDTDFESLLEQLLADRGADSEHVDPQSILLASILESISSGRRQEQLVTAPRTDAYGNRTYYDPVRGWLVDTTPQTQALLEADLREQLLGLTEDAERNRSGREREEGRSLLANDAFETAFNDYRFRDRKSEDEYIGDATRDLAMDRQDSLSQFGDVLGRQALRTGGSPRDFAQAFERAQQTSGQGLRSLGRQQGMQQFATLEGAKNNQAQNEINLLAGLSGQDGRVNTPQTQLPQQLTNTSTQALTALIQALMANDQTRSGQTASLVSLLSKG